MRFVIAPLRLERMIKSATFHKSGSLISEVLAQCTKDGIAFNVNAFAVSTFTAFYTKGYFQEFKSEDELVPLTENLLKKLGWGFKDEKLTVTSTDGTLIVEDTRDKYTENKIDLKDEEALIPMEQTPYGIIPKIPEGAKHSVIFKMNSEELNLSKIPGDIYTFEAKKDRLLVSVADDSGSFTKEIFPVEVVEFNEPVTIELNGDYAQRIFANVSGEIFLILDRHEDKGGIVVSEFDKTHSLTYILRRRDD